MNEDILRKIGLTGNEIKIYINLLKSGASSAYKISKNTGIYRVHVYDKLEQLMNKGLVTYVYKGAKKHFQATHPSKIKYILEEKKKNLEFQEKQVDSIMPELIAMTTLPREDTFVEVFKGVEGLKYMLKDVLKTGKEILIMGLDDDKYDKALGIYMRQYFRDAAKKGINERVITVQKPGIFLFDKSIAPTTTYRFLEEKQFNPTNTFVYGDKLVIVTWGNPITAIMITNNEIAETYRNNFERLWKIAKE